MPRLFGVLSFAFCLFSCAAPGDPMRLAVRLADPALDDAVRQEADRRMVQIAGPGDEGRLAALQFIVQQPAQPPAMRVYALDQLAAADPERLAGLLAECLPDFTGSVLDHACGLAGDLHDQRLVAPLIRSLDRMRPPEEGRPPGPRPEEAALAVLSGKPLPETLASVALHDARLRSRVAALDLLPSAFAPRDPRNWFLELRVPEGDVWLANIRSWTLSFGTPPVGINEHAWVQTLYEPANGGLLAQALAHHRLLADQPDYVAAPRFVQTLALTDEAALRRTRGQLLSDLQARLAPLRHVRREPSSPGAIDDVPETLASCEPLLSRCDLFNLGHLLDALAAPATRAEILRRGLEDRADTTTEHGGVLSLRSAGDLTITVIPPMVTGNDRAYVTSDKALALAPTSLALFHFHFQKADNAELAGPGAGDLQFARAMRVSCVVISSIDDRSFDVDYYNPQGAVVDLGIYAVLTAP